LVNKGFHVKTEKRQRSGERAKREPRTRVEGRQAARKQKGTWGVDDSKDVKVLEGIKRRATKQVTVLKACPVRGG